MSAEKEFDSEIKLDKTERRKDRGSNDIEHSTMSSYLDALKNHPQLKHQEMVELFKEYEKGGEVAQKARKKLIESNLRLVISIAKQYKNYNVPIEDLIQEGNIGLMKSIERFDWKRGFRFSTYSTWWIKQAIGQYVLKRKRTIRLPAHAATVQRKMLQAAERFRDNTGFDPTTEELTELVGASETVVKATIHSGRGTISLNQSFNGEAGQEGNTLENRLQDESAGSDPFKNVAEKQLIEIVRDVLCDLTAKEAAILRLRFGLIEDNTDSNSYPITEAEAHEVMHGKGMR